LPVVTLEVTLNRFIMETNTNRGTKGEGSLDDKKTRQAEDAEARQAASEETATADQSTGHAYDGSGLDSKDMENLQNTKRGSDVGPDTDITV
jgi:hypothetical protein